MNYAIRILEPSKCFDGTDPETAILKPGVMPAVTHTFQAKTQSTFLNMNPQPVIRLENKKIVGLVKKESKRGFPPSAEMSIAAGDKISFDERLIYEIQHAILMYVYGIYKNDNSTFKKVFPRMAPLMTDKGYTLETESSVPIRYLKEEIRNGVRHIVRRTEPFEFIGEDGQSKQVQPVPKISHICIETKKDEKDKTKQSDVIWKETSNRIERTPGCQFIDQSVLVAKLREEAKNPKSDECKAAVENYNKSIALPWTLDTIDSYITDGTMCSTLIVTIRRISTTKVFPFSFKLKANQVIYDPTVVGEFFNDTMEKYRNIQEPNTSTGQTSQMQETSIDVTDEGE